jgi:hypothetical protein
MAIADPHAKWSVGLSRKMYIYSDDNAAKCVRFLFCSGRIGGQTDRFLLVDVGSH